MQLSRIALGSVGLSAFLLLAPKQSSGDKSQQRVATLTVACEFRFDATITSPGVTQDPQTSMFVRRTRLGGMQMATTSSSPFKNKSPFKDHQMVFKASGNGFAESAEMDHFDHIQAFPFSIKVDDHTYDPQIIGGGGH